MKKKPSVGAFRTPPKQASNKPTPHATPDGLPNNGNSISNSNSNGNGIHETPNLLSESPAMLGMKSKLNGIPPPPLPVDVGFWDGEAGTDTTPDMDMDMDMFTEEGDGDDVDEEVRSHSPPIQLNLT
jgi:hypothetical protein